MQPSIGSLILLEGPALKRILPLHARCRTQDCQCAASTSAFNDSSQLLTALNHQASPPSPRFPCGRSGARSTSPPEDRSYSQCPSIVSHDLMIVFRLNRCFTFPLFASRNSLIAIQMSVPGHSFLRIPNLLVIPFMCSFLFRGIPPDVLMCRR